MLEVEEGNCPHNCDSQGWCDTPVAIALMTVALVTEEESWALWMSSYDAARKLRQLWLSCGRVNITCSFLVYFYLFIYLFLTVPHSMQDLSSPTRDHTHAPTMEAWIPNHRTARVSPNITWFWPVSSQGWSLGGASPCVVCPWAASWNVCKPQTVLFTMISLRWPKCVTLLVKVLRSSSPSILGISRVTGAFEERSSELHLDALGESRGRGGDSWEQHSLVSSRYGCSVITMPVASHGQLLTCT